MFKTTDFEIISLANNEQGKKFSNTVRVTIAIVTPWIRCFGIILMQRNLDSLVEQTIVSGGCLGRSKVLYVYICVHQRLFTSPSRTYCIEAMILFSDIAFFNPVVLTCGFCWPFLQATTNTTKNLTKARQSAICLLCNSRD